VGYGDDGVPDDGDWEAEEHDYPTELCAVGDDGYAHGYDCCNCIRNNGPKLCNIRIFCESKGVDDSREL